MWGAQSGVCMHVLGLGAAGSLGVIRAMAFPGGNVGGVSAVLEQWRGAWGVEAVRGNMWGSVEAVQGRMGQEGKGPSCAVWDAGGASALFPPEHPTIHAPYDCPPLQNMTPLTPF